MRYVGIREREAVRAFFREMKAAAKRNFKRDGALAPVAVFLCGEERVILPLDRVVNNKNAAAAFLNLCIERLKPLAFAFVCEAWIATAKPQPGEKAGLEGLYGDSLTEKTADGSDKPKAGVKEGVMIQCSSLAGDNYTLTAFISRRGKPSLEPWQRFENKEAEGRFVFNVTPLSERQ